MLGRCLFWVQLHLSLLAFLIKNYQFLYPQIEFNTPIFILNIITESISFTSTTSFVASPLHAVMRNADIAIIFFILIYTY